MPIIFHHKILLCMTAVDHMLLNCRAMSTHTSTVVLLRVKTDPSLTFGHVRFFKAILIGPEPEM